MAGLNSGVRGIRFCAVTEDAETVAAKLGPSGLGLQSTLNRKSGDPFVGAVFPASDSDATWIEIWPASEGMPPGVMLQIVVDDVDAWGARAREAGINFSGPYEAHGEKCIYLTDLPFGVTVQSSVDG